jgi:hypothetical protein
MSAHPNCRIGSVTLRESGLRIVRLTDGVERTRRAILSQVRAMIDGMGTDTPSVGFAFVVWSADGTSNAIGCSYPGSNIPGILIPDFARNRLLAAKIDEWVHS